MKVTTLREIFKNKEAYYDQEVTVGGWVRSNRDSKQFGFLTISESAFQCIFFRLIAPQKL